MLILRGLGRALLVSCALALIVGPVNAMPPTDEVTEQWIADGVWQENVAVWQAFKAAGGCAPGEHSPLETFRAARAAALGSDVVDTINVVVLLVEFPDYRASGQGVSATVADFEALLFSDRRTDPSPYPTGSMTDFYVENSYGALVITGDVFGWYMMPQDYSWYVGDNYGLGGGGALLAGHAVDAAEAAGVDFSLYANGDTWVDGVIVVHPGPGAESAGTGIWSHQSTISPLRNYDNVLISDYTVNPEESYYGSLSTIGVFGHEYGHVIGLPDLYDLNPIQAQKGSGLGSWSMMANGSWNGGPPGSSPAHFDAWCKLMLDFGEVAYLESNLSQAALPQVEESGVIYHLGTVPGDAAHEYWLVENRQRVGFDQSLPGGGLCIYHFDPFVASQNDHDRYRVALEQADGEEDLYYGFASDAGDPWPGITGNSNFHAYTIPDSRTNDGDITDIAVWNIRNSGPVIYADLDVEFSRPYVVFAETKDSVRFRDKAPGGNGNGIVEAGETIEASFRVRNKMRLAYDPTFTLSVDAPGVNFIQNGVPLAAATLSPVFDAWNEVPIKFSLPADFVTVQAGFTLTLEADSISGSGDRAYVQELTFEWRLGRTQVLVVDDDGGAAYESRFENSLDRLRIPYDVWDKSSSSPSYSDLAPYPFVLWFTGSSANGGTLTAGDVSVLKQFLDNRGNLYLSSMTAASQLHGLDSAFLADYLHANLVSSDVFGLGFNGVDGNPVGEGAAFALANNAPSPFHLILEPVGGGQAAFELSEDYNVWTDLGTCGVTFSERYRTILTTFGFEFLGNEIPLYGVYHRDSLMRRVLSFFAEGIATPVEDRRADDALPAGFALAQNYPNPFNPVTTVTYTVGGGNHPRELVATRLTIYNTLGQKVTTMVDELKYPGTYTVVWDGTGSGGRQVASGVYLYRLESDGRHLTRKMLFLK
ncbi:MAG TPA: M6 family metalloprotease domain-containing protein [Acidobacteriota bacterium]|nr:M6 family metalloprotease domain-containing protein [Acidobacteriota bacterium]